MSIYDQIGGADAVRVAVDMFYDRVLGDPVLAPYFDGVDVRRVKAHQRAFLSAAIGGPQLYQGRSMEAAHSGLDITPDAFGPVVTHLVATLTELGVPEATISDIGAALAPLAADIVTEKVA